MSDREGGMGLEAAGEPQIEAMAKSVRAGEVEAGHYVQMSLRRIAASALEDRPLNAFLSAAEPSGAGSPESGGAAEAGPEGKAENRGAAAARGTSARSNDAAAAGARGGSSALVGVPIAVKDNLATLDFPTTCGSRILQGYRSPYEATVVRRLRSAGAGIVGKTNMDEFAMGSSSENSAYGAVRNPHDRDRVPGGSSGGSAAAVAAGLVPGALGSDTGGSVRQPASLCGVVGIKPTYGRVSRYGLVAFASSLDQVGTFGRSVRDATVLLQVIAGHDSRDSTSAEREVPDWLAAAARGGAPAGVEGLVVGVPTEYFPDSLDPEIRRLCDEALDRLRERGAIIRPVSLPHTDLAIPTYYIIAPAEASSNLARYDGVRYGVRGGEARSTADVYEESRSAGFGLEVKRRIMLGTYVLSAGYHEAYYGRAQKVRGLIAGDFEQVFARRRGMDAGSGGSEGSDQRAGRDAARGEGRVDVLFTPTSPSTAFGIGERVDDPLRMYLSDLFTVTANLAGVPAISLPIGSVRGLPVGGQIIAPKWDEETMVRAAAGLEAALAEGGTS